MNVLFVAACLLVDVALVCLAARASRPTTGSRVGCGVWCALAVVWAALWCMGTVTCSDGLACLAQVLFGLAAAVTLARPSLTAYLRPLGIPLRLLALVACVPIAYLMCELTYSDAPFDVEDPWLTMQLLAAALLVVWFVFQQRPAASLGFLVACWVWGLANYFLSIFKGQTVLPSDVLALGTAAEVASGYVYQLGDAPVSTLCILLAAACALLCIPSPRLSRLRASVSLLCGLLVCANLVNWYETHDIEEEYEVTVDVWATRDSYMQYGSVPCFLQRMQEVKPDPPEGYSTEAAAALQETLAADWDASHPGYDEASEATLDDAPCVVTIMNESFSDMSMYAGLEGYYDATQRLADLGCIEVGAAYTSVRGGGTCNSEFEYLTGSTLGLMGGGVYPYMLYDLGGCESLPHYFSALGYDTTAIHPAAATNWRRDVVYQELGFDSYHSGDEYVDADKLRDLCTDRETYDTILEVLRDETDSPQFIFDVTLQNHGGYETGLLDDHSYDDVTVNGTQVAGLSEYLGCIDASFEDLEYLLDELSQLDRKVIVVFFGDHQPGFNDEVSAASTGVAVGSQGIEQVQQRFETSYMVWANYDLAAETCGEVTGDDLSLGYLMARTAYAAGLPLTDYQKALLRIEEDLPAANLNGYQDAQGTWHWNGETSSASIAYAWYGTLQYANLFDADGNAAFDDFRARREG